MSYQETHFWKIFQGQEQPGVQAQNEAQRLVEQFKSSRQRASLIAAEINRSSADLTQHDISHIDALWDYAELVCGTSYTLNPAEIYVLGISFLAHDLANGMAAIPGGMGEIVKDVRWRDILASEYRSKHGTYPSSKALTSVDQEVETRAVARYLRETHADYASKLPLAPYEDHATGTSYYLIEDAELRNQYGHLAGRIAASHWWPAKTLRQEFGVKIGARASMPTSWEVDPLVLACILRCADASHLDSRRAPAFLRAVRTPGAESMPHWVFQDKLQKPRINDDRLAYTSLSPFGKDDSEAWWVCHDALATLHHELTTVDTILSDAGRQRFSARAVSGVSDLEELARSIRTDGWHPIDASIKATDVITLVRRLGGAELYGDDSSAPIRELISNAADAVRAKRALLLDAGVASWEISGDITVALRDDEHGSWLSVRDTGLGMSKEVLTNALLNFGTSYWDSAQSRKDLPGLLSSGFRPTGQYGIGFFSVFMIGRTVQVISRRYDAAASETLVLDFTDGLTGRPMLRAADSHEHLMVGGTEVRVLLKESVDHILSIGYSAIRDREPRTLSEYCSWLCPALDVNLYVVNDEADRTLVVEADDWKTIDRNRLIDRLYVDHSPAVRKAILESASGDLEPVISPAREIVARMAAAPSFVDPEDVSDDHSDDTPHRTWVRPSAPVVVGGVRSQTSMHGFIGLVVGNAVRAARDSAVPVIETQDFSVWASSQAQCWKSSWDSFHKVSEVLVALHAETARMPVARMVGGDVTYGQLVSRCENLSRIILVQDAAWANYCRRQTGSQTLREDVVLLSAGRQGILSGGREPHANDWALTGWAFRSEFDSAPPNSMLGVLVRAVSEAWGVSEEILRSFYSDQLESEEQQVEIVGVTHVDGVSRDVRLRSMLTLSRDELQRNT
ncbi:HD domain-containing protein [[Kitasatospora] papulosa]|uniref:HD domain-containing protein n=1 Tax=[Kitasatospora] papulosa TaxID=1464011 RepID=UPI00369FBD08